MGHAHFAATASQEALIIALVVEGRKNGTLETRSKTN